MSWVEVDGSGWSWVELDGAGWSWGHGLVIPIIYHYILSVQLNILKTFLKYLEFHIVAW